MIILVRRISLKPRSRDKALLFPGENTRPPMLPKRAGPHILEAEVDHDKTGLQMLGSASSPLLIMKLSLSIGPGYDVYPFPTK